jgi:hypothetical protein
LKEYLVQTPEGHKAYRFADVAVLRGGKPKTVYQIGDVLKKARSTPIARERKAIEDLHRQIADVRYVPKD